MQLPGIMEEFSLKDVAPIDEGWHKLMESKLCLYVIRNIVSSYEEFGFDLYIYNLQGRFPKSEYEEVPVKIYYRKKEKKPI